MIHYLSPKSQYAMADEWYEYATEDHFWMSWRFEVLKRMIPKGYDWGEALDIGCGNGIARKQIETYYDCSVSACDLNADVLAKLPDGKGSLYFYNIHQKNPEFHERFHTILLFDVLEHIENPVMFLESVNFHLKPGGRVILNLPAAQLFYSNYDRIAGHVKRYTISVLRKELKKAGLSFERAVYWGASLVPVLLARKWVVSFCRDSEVIRRGFQPPSPTVNSFFLWLMQMENSIPLPFIGTSLMAMAKKAN